ncbi:alpha/beta hydrolase, partial [Thalassospira xiamenensis]
CYDFPNIDNERHLTKYNPVPGANGSYDTSGNLVDPTTQTVNALITVPDLATVNALRTAQGQPTLTQPAEGWPVVVYYHGITGDKTNAFGIAGALSVAGFATVSIDHPLHGDRGFGAINASDSEDGNVTAYMNLSSLLTARDNLRQSVADLLSLRVGLNFTNAPINGADVQFLGHSLGAIAGASFTGITNTPMEGPLAAANGLFAVNASSLAMPGQSIANFLLDSPSFGPVVKSQLLYAAVPEFEAAVNGAAEANGVEPGSEAFMGLMVQVYGQFMQSIDDAQLAQINATFAQFAFAAQSVLDSADPINYASAVVASETPVHLIEV